MGEIKPTALSSVSDHSCQVRQGKRNAVCLRPPRYLVAVAMAVVEGVSQRTYRMCEEHAQSAARSADWQLIAVRPYTPPEPSR